MKAQRIPKDQQSGPIFDPPSKSKPDRFSCAPREGKSRTIRVTRYEKAGSGGYYGKEQHD